MGCHTWTYTNPQTIPTPIQYDECEFEMWKQQNSLNCLEIEIKQLKSWVGEKSIDDEILRYLFEKELLSSIVDTSELIILSPDRKTFYTEISELHDIFRIDGYPSFILHNHKQAVKELRAFCESDVTKVLDWQYGELTANSSNDEWSQFENYLFELWQQYPDLVIDFG